MSYLIIFIIAGALQLLLVLLNIAKFSETVLVKTELIFYWQKALKFNIFTFQSQTFGKKVGNNIYQDATIFMLFLFCFVWSSVCVI